MFEMLIAAIKEVDEKKAKFLIKKMSQYELNSTDESGRNAFHLAVLKQIELKKSLTNDKRETEKVQKKVLSNARILKSLHDKCSEHALRVADDFGKTALNYASDSADNALIDMVFYGYIKTTTYCDTPANHLKYQNDPMYAFGVSCIGNDYTSQHEFEF